MFTTMKKLALRVNSAQEALVKYDDNIFLICKDLNGNFYAEVYEFIETPNDSGVSVAECRLVLIKKSKTCFLDGGHALAWCIE